MSEYSEQQQSMSKIKTIKDGFRINFMKMKDGTSGETMWECADWDLNVINKNENLPKRILLCSEIVREINFSSDERIDNLELIQNFYLHENLIESSRFVFGFVIPQSTNNWEQIIQAKEDGVLPVEVLSGNLSVETFFISNGHTLSKSRITIFYV